MKKYFQPTPSNSSKAFEAQVISQTQLDKLDCLKHRNRTMEHFFKNQKHRSSTKPVKILPKPQGLSGLSNSLEGFWSPYLPASDAKSVARFPFQHVFQYQQHFAKQHRANTNASPHQLKMKTNFPSPQFNKRIALSAITQPQSQIRSDSICTDENPDRENSKGIPNHNHQITVRVNEKDSAVKFHQPRSAQSNNLVHGTSVDAQELSPAQHHKNVTKRLDLSPKLIMKNDLNNKGKFLSPKIKPNNQAKVNASHQQKSKHILFQNGQTISGLQVVNCLSNTSAKSKLGNRIQDLGEASCHSDLFLSQLFSHQQNSVLDSILDVLQSKSQEKISVLRQQLSNLKHEKSARGT